MAESPEPAIMARLNPFRSALGLRVSFPGPGQARVDADPRPASQGDDGCIAPGVLLTLMDIALGHAVASRLPEPSSFATVSLQILVRSAWPTGRLTAAAGAQPLAPDWREAAAEGTVYSSKGDPVATAQGFFARGAGGGRHLAPVRDADGFGSFRELLGLRDAEDSLVMAVEHRHLNPDGVMHGGAMAAFLDEAMRAGLRKDGAGPGRLGSFSIRYLLPGRPGALRAFPRVERHGRRIHFASASALGEDGGLLSTAEATYLEDLG